MTSGLASLHFGHGGISPGQVAHTLSEAFAASPTDAAVTGFVLSRLPASSRTLLWVQDRLSQKEAGCPYLPGLRHRPVIRVDVSRPADVLWVMEEALRCQTLAGVIGEVWGDHSVLNFTATKRLAQRAEANKVACWLIRRAAVVDLSAARDRWRIGSLPSLPHLHDVQAPGSARWQAELFRSRHHKPGIWTLGDDRAADRIDFPAAFRDGTLAARDGTAKRSAAR